MALAIATNIPPSVWAEEGEQAIVTAMEILEEQEKATNGKGGGGAGLGAGGPQYSG